MGCFALQLSSGSPYFLLQICQKPPVLSTDESGAPAQAEQTCLNPSGREKVEREVGVTVPVHCRGLD